MANLFEANKGREIQILLCPSVLEQRKCWVSAYNYQGNQQPSVQGNTSTYNYQGNPQQGNTSAINYQGNQQPSVQGNTNV